MVDDIRRSSRKQPILFLIGMPNLAWSGSQATSASGKHQRCDIGRNSMLHGKQADEFATCHRYGTLSRSDTAQRDIGNPDIAGFHVCGMGTLRQETETLACC